MFNNLKANITDLSKNTKLHKYTHIALLLVNLIIFALAFAVMFRSTWNATNSVGNLSKITSIWNKTGDYIMMYYSPLAFTFNIIVVCSSFVFSIVHVRYAFINKKQTLNWVWVFVSIIIACFCIWMLNYTNSIHDNTSAGNLHHIMMAKKGQLI